VKLGERKVRLLKEVEIDEVSLVTSPANEGAKVMFWKSDNFDFSKLNAFSVEELTAAMKAVDYQKIGISQGHDFMTLPRDPFVCNELDMLDFGNYSPFHTLHKKWGVLGEVAP